MGAPKRQYQAMSHNQIDGPAPDELTQDEVFRLLERTASEDHPNPERKGCPSQETLAAFAQNPREFPMDDPIFEHVQNCSPCFLCVRARNW
jgi:hypothetical protein